MAKFGIFLTMVGSVLGCGFFSGKEIAVFFTRFGAWSYLGVALSFFLFFFIFRFLLSIGSSVTSKMRTSKPLLAINLSICIIFSSAMFGCLQEVTGQAVSKFVFLMLVVALCALILKKGFSAFDRLNQFLVPLMIFAFLLLLCFNVDFSIPQTDSALPFPSIFYSISLLRLKQCKFCRCHCLARSDFREERQNTSGFFLSPRACPNLVFCKLYFTSKSRQLIFIYALFDAYLFLAEFYT